MFARIAELNPKIDRKDDLMRVIRSEVLPILREQPGFLDILPFLPESNTEMTLAVTFWAGRSDAERYEVDIYPRVAEIIEPYLTTPVTFRRYAVDSSAW